MHYNKNILHIPHHSYARSEYTQGEASISQHLLATLARVAKHMVVPIYIHTLSLDPAATFTVDVDTWYKANSVAQRLGHKDAKQAMRMHIEAPDKHQYHDLASTDKVRHGMM